MSTPTVQELLQTLIDSQTKSLEQMQALMQAFNASLTFQSGSQPKVCTSVTLTNQELQEVQPKPNSVNDGFYVLILDPAAAFKVKTLYVESCFDIFALSPLLFCFNSPQQQITYAPAIRKGVFEIYYKDRKLNTTGKLTVLSVACMFIQWMFNELTTMFLDKFQSNQVAYSQDSTIRQQTRELVGFSLLAFIEAVKLNGEDKQRIHWTWKHETVRLLIKLLRVTELASIYEQTGVSKEPIFPFVRDDPSCPTLRTPNISTITSYFVEQVITEIKDNRWLWQIICLFSFPLSFNNNEYEPVFDISSNLVNSFLRFVKVDHARDTVGRIKSSSSSLVHRVSMCMEALQSYAQPIGTKDIALMIWTQLWLMHQQLQHLNVQKHFNASQFKDFNLRQEMFKYMVTCKSNFPESQHYWPLGHFWPLGQTNDQVTSIVGGWFLWMKVTEKLSSMPNQQFKWSWLFVEKTDHLEKNYNSNVETLLALIKDSQRPYPPIYRYCPHSSKRVEMESCNLAYSLKRLHFICEQMWTYGPPELVIKVVFANNFQNNLSFHTRFMFLMQCFTMELKQLQSISDPKHYNLLLEHGLSWWIDAVEREVKNALMVDQELTIEVVTNAFKKTVYSAIDLLRLFVNSNLNVEELQKTKHVWIRVYRLLSEYASNKGLSCTWGSYKLHRVRTLKYPNTGHELEVLYTLAVDGYEPWELLSKKDIQHIESMVEEPEVKKAKIATEFTEPPVELDFEAGGNKELERLESELRQQSQESYNACAPGMIALALNKCLENNWNIKPILSTYSTIPLEYDAYDLLLSAVKKNRFEQFCRLLETFESFIAARTWTYALVPEMIALNRHEMLKVLICNTSVSCSTRELEINLAKAYKAEECLKLLESNQRKVYPLIA